MTLVLVFVLSRWCHSSHLYQSELKSVHLLFRFCKKKGGPLTILSTLQDEHFHWKRSRIGTNAPPMHERIIAAFVTVANSRGLLSKLTLPLTLVNVGLS